MVFKMVLYSLRNLKKQKFHSLINILGFAIALVPAILIFILVRYELSYENFHKDNAKLFRVIQLPKVDKLKLGKWGVIPAPISYLMEQEIPEVEVVCKIWKGKYNIEYKNEVFADNEVVYADLEFTKLFEIDLLKGNIDNYLKDKFSILISDKLAHKLFGNSNPIGEIVNIAGLSDYKVCGIYKKFPNNTHLQFDALAPNLASVSNNSYSSIDDEYSWGMSKDFLYFKVSDPSKIRDVERKINELVQKYAPQKFKETSFYFCQSINDIHLYSDLLYDIDQNGDIDSVLLYISIGIILLIIAITNYINLTTAKASKRGREISIKKVIGAKKRQLFFQVSIEALIVTLLATIFAVCVSYFLLEYFNEFVQRDLSFNSITGVEYIIVLFIIVGISLLSAIYPFTVITSIKPIDLISNNFSKSKGRIFRNSLVVLQFSITSILLFVSFAINNQMQFLSEKELGFNTSNILTVRLNKNIELSKFEIIKNQIMDLNGVNDVCLSYNIPGLVESSSIIDIPGQINENDEKAFINHIDYSYIDLYDLKLIKGRNFDINYSTDVNESIIINETALKYADFGDNPLGKIINFNGPRQVVGILKDFHNRSLHNKISPNYFILGKGINIISISFEERFEKEIKLKLNKIILDFKGDKSYDINHISTELNENYFQDKVIQTIIVYCTFLGIFISCLGILGLISYSTERRKKEIGIRKVIGASTHNVINLFFKEMAMLITISLIISSPISYYIIQKWLNNFAYKSTLGFLSILLILFIVYILAGLVMFIQVYKASKQNPVDVLKYD